MIGFDFGTTNSLISIIQDNQSIPILDEANRPIPSVVAYSVTETIVGKAAKELIHSNNNQFDIISSPKTLLGMDDISASGVSYSPVDVVCEVIKHVKNHAQQRIEKEFQGEYLRDALKKAVVTIPVNMDGYRRSLLRDAFNSAGIQIFQFVHEPLAALYAYIRDRFEKNKSFINEIENKMVLVFDWGGGTLDLTLCRIKDNTLYQIGNDGVQEDVGGDCIDAVIKNHIERLARDMPNRKELISLSKNHDADKKLMSACENLKIQLSAQESAYISVNNFFDHEDVDVADIYIKITRSQLNEIIEKNIDKGIQRISNLLDSKGYSANSIHLCVATGGMINMPIIQHKLRDKFGAKKVEVTDKNTTLIAQGAAWIAHDQARLKLSKSLELLLARGNYMQLLQKGFELPIDNQSSHLPTYSLYCVDPSDGVVYLNFVTPSNIYNRQPMPNDPRKDLGLVTLPIDKNARLFEERISLEVRVDQNLIFSAIATAGNSKQSTSYDIFDLDFSLDLPLHFFSSQNTEDTDCRKDDLDNNSSLKTNLIIRSNVANSYAHDGLDLKDKKLVPGEVLYKYEPEYFDTRNDPPALQIREKLYYEKCSVCGLNSNHAQCTCSNT